MLITGNMIRILGDFLDKLAPIFSNGSSSSISLAMLTPSAGDGEHPLLLEDDVAALEAERRGFLTASASWFIPSLGAAGLLVESNQLGHVLRDSFWRGPGIWAAGSLPATDSKAAGGPFPPTLLTSTHRSRMCCRSTRRVPAGHARARTIRVQTVRLLYRGTSPRSRRSSPSHERIEPSRSFARENAARHPGRPPTTL